MAVKKKHKDAITFLKKLILDDYELIKKIGN